MEEKITCRQLWVNLISTDPDNELVIKAKEKMKDYAKGDWKIMSAEATRMTKALAQLVEYNVDPKSELAELGFMELHNHFTKWFFELDQRDAISLALHTKYDKDYREFFTTFHEGLADYLNDLTKAHFSKLPKTVD
jgi:hypothetical protein